VRQVGGDGAAKELMHAGSQATASAADNDHLRIQHLGESSKRMCDIPGQLAEFNAYAFLVGQVTNPAGQAAIKDCGIPVRLVGIDRSGLHRSIRMFGDDIAASVDIRADQHSLEQAGEAGCLSQHR